MEISKIPYPDLSLQSLPYSLNPDQLRERLITLDFRENDVFRFALGCEDESPERFDLLIYQRCFISRLSEQI